jgi:hypothetical protein
MVNFWEMELEKGDVFHEVAAGSRDENASN